MSQFQFASRTCSLDFCGQVQVQLPLTVEFSVNMQKAGQRMSDRIKAITGSEVQQADEMYEAIMDCVDEILGEGMADRIMDCCPQDTEPDASDALQVLDYIKNEYNAAFAARFSRKGKETASSPKQAPPRHRRKGRK